MIQPRQNRCFSVPLKKTLNIFLLNSKYLSSCYNNKKTTTIYNFKNNWLDYYRFKLSPRPYILNIFILPLQINPVSENVSSSLILYVLVPKIYKIGLYLLSILHVGASLTNDAYIFIFISNCLPRHFLMLVYYSFNPSALIKISRFECKSSLWDSKKQHCHLSELYGDSHRKRLRLELSASKHICGGRSWGTCDSVAEKFVPALEDNKICIYIHTCL